MSEWSWLAFLAGVVVGTGVLVLATVLAAVRDAEAPNGGRWR